MIALRCACGGGGGIFWGVGGSRGVISMVVVFVWGGALQGFLFFVDFLLVLAEYSFRQGDWALNFPRS